MENSAATFTYPWGDQRRFNSYRRFLQDRFGGRMQKLTLDAGFTCPNRDGTLGYGGCTYCLNDAFNPSYCHASKSIEQQLKEGIEFHQNRYRRSKGYLAYFQAFSNSYAPLSHLKKIYEIAFKNDQIKGIVIGTRPDCMDKEKLNYLAELNKRLFVSVEYGIESCHNNTLKHIHRGHSFERSVETIAQTHEMAIHTGGHFIYGLPDETPEQWFEDIHTINRLQLDSIKFHQLQIIKGTLMEKEYIEGPCNFYHFTADSYIDFIVGITERLNRSFIIERFAGEVPPRFLSVNNWVTMRYDIILQKIEDRLESLDTYQGKKYVEE